jgi:phage host-nuclease inhibitor protein Gam
MNRITQTFKHISRVEVIDENGRSYVNWEEDNDITVSYQDDGRTLKVFVNTMKPKTGEERALEALDKFQNDWLLGKKCPETKLEIKNLNSVESIKAEIKVLQSKLEFYEELEKQPLTLFDVIRNLGYSVDMCDEIVDAVEEFQKSKEPEKEQQIKELVRESVKWCEEHPDESVEDYLKPHTPEKTEQLLREAFQKVQQTEEWKETQRKIDAPKESWMNKSDEELVAILEKNPPDCLKFVMGKTLEQIIERWWCDTFTGPHEKWSMEECIDDLIDQIELFLPRSQSSEGTQNIDTVVAVEAHNELLQKIKSKLRNKKDT